MQFVPGPEHNIDQANVYEDVITLYYEGNVMSEYPLFIKYKGENAID